MFNAVDDNRLVVSLLYFVLPWTGVLCFVYYVYLSALFSGALVRSLYCCAARHFGGGLDSILNCIHLCFAGPELLLVGVELGPQSG